MAPKRKRVTQSAADSAPTSATPPQQPSALPLPHPTNDPTKYRVVTRLPNAHPPNARSIHVSRSTKFAPLNKRVKRLLQTSSRPIVLHAMGAAMQHSCELALAIQRHAHGTLQLVPLTSTQQVYDDYQPLVEGYDEITRCRNVSAIRITIRKTSVYVYHKQPKHTK
ncbi:Ribonuclease P protein subunit p20 [Gracilariopsis chorda]|uniref:Ribonuclease P protein subunit p20 n=1 Tax=Gracilariopsis chorda TaxID=448386 RepID=A0A2V3IFS8_9FLOR|nr:Ribonuclease P protein subunit p20 [Gracilariopsis chorda]|eukprot:PXF40949.1 Ribonuclease P protein subunit p20 [Gracilariopsis chorda]